MVITQRLIAAGVHDYVVAVAADHVDVSVNPGVSVDVSGLPVSRIRIEHRRVDIDNMTLPIDD